MGIFLQKQPALGKTGSCEELLNPITVFEFETDLSAFTCAGVLQRVDQSGRTCCRLHEEDNIQMLGLL